jgi:hypothetical protein
VNAPAFGVALTAEWSAATAHGRAGIGGLRGGGASFVSLKAENDGAIAGLPMQSATASAASAAVEPAGNSTALVASARDLVLTRTDGTALPAIDADARITAVDLATLGTRPQEVVLAWLRGTPNLTIDNVRIAMGGAIVTATGNLSVSQDGLLSGSILLRYNSAEALGNLMETLRPGSRERFNVVLQGLQMMSVPATTEDGPMLQTTISIRNGITMVGIAPVGIIPAFRF